VDGVNLLGHIKNTIKENPEASRDIGLEINAEKTKYMIMSRHQNSERYQNIRIANESFENVAKFKYLGTTLTNQNVIHDEIKSRLNSENACSYSVKNLLSSRLVSKNLNIKMYRTVILPVVLYGCKTWSLTLGEEHKLRVFENRVLRKIFGPKREEDVPTLNVFPLIREKFTLVTTLNSRNQRNFSVNPDFVIVHFQFYAVFDVCCILL
jgi:hypothetical protein